jgi:C-terminal processing protease CtpA/Prc
MQTCHALWCQANILITSTGRPAKYLRLHYVSSSATHELEALVRRSEREDVAGYILDLRNNPGAC